MSRKKNLTFGKAALIGLGAAAVAAGAAVAYLMYLEWEEEGGDYRSFLKSKGPIHRSKEILNRFRDRGCCADCCDYDDYDDCDDDEDQIEFNEDDFVIPGSAEE